MFVFSTWGFLGYGPFGIDRRLNWVTFASLIDHHALEILLLCSHLCVYEYIPTLSWVYQNIVPRWNLVSTLGIWKCPLQMLTLPWGWPPVLGLSPGCFPPLTPSQMAFEKSPSDILLLENPLPHIHLLALLRLLQNLPSRPLSIPPASILHSILSNQQHR